MSSSATAASLTLLLLATAVAPAQTLFVQGATVIDGTGARPRVADVVVSEGEITAIGSRLQRPRRARLINGRGKFLIPGLWDMHVHLWESQPMFSLYTSAGVVGVRDMGSDLQRTRKWSKQALAGTGPRVVTPGPPVEGPGTNKSKFPSIRVSTPDDGRRAADQIDDSRADFIKVLSSVPRDAYIALAERARLRRAVFAGHLPETVTVREAVNARQKSIEHLFGLPLACSEKESEIRAKRVAALAAKDFATVRALRAEIYESFNEAKAVELFKQMIRLESWQVPTLTLMQRMTLVSVDKLAKDPHLKSVPAAIRKTWTDPANDLKEITPERMAALREEYDFHRRLVTLMHKTGVPLLAGTDTGDDYVVPGWSLHDELALLVDAGLSPIEAIQTATRNAARYLGLEETTGTIQKGKSADLVLLNADPLKDIRNTKRIAAVVVRGKLAKRSQ